MVKTTNNVFCMDQFGGVIKLPTFYSYNRFVDMLLLLNCLLLFPSYKMWHYSGKLFSEYSVPREKELWEVVWKPFPAGTFPSKPVIAQQQSAKQVDAKPAVYRPPNASKTAASSFKLNVGVLLLS